MAGGVRRHDRGQDMNRMRLCAIALLAATLLPGCRKAEESASEAIIESASGGDVDVERDGDTTTIRSRDGDGEGEMRVQAGMDLKLPADFPDDVYLPTKYSVNSVMDMGPVKMIALSTPQAVPVLFAQAGSTMHAKGWKQLSAMQHASGNAMLAFQKDRREVALSFNQSRSATGTVMSVQLRSDAR